MVLTDVIVLVGRRLHHRRDFLMDGGTTATFWWGDHAQAGETTQSKEHENADA